MNINLTLIGQTISFIVFVWFCMKFIWPPLIKALDERKQTIADGLAAAERGKREQQLAEKNATQAMHDAKVEAADIIAQAQKRASEIVDESKGEAREEGERILLAARSEIDQEVNRAKEELRGHLGKIVVLGASKVLDREVDQAAHDALIKELVAEI